MSSFIDSVVSEDLLPRWVLDAAGGFGLVWGVINVIADGPSFWRVAGPVLMAVVILIGHLLRFYSDRARRLDDRKEAADRLAFLREDRDRREKREHDSK